MLDTSYLNTALDVSQLREAVAAATKTLANVQFDAIAVRGNSGTLFGGALSVALGKGIILIRKPQESSHASYMSVEGHNTYGTYIFVDDFISGGDTLRAVVSAVSGKWPHMRLVGAYLYRDNEFIKPYRLTPYYNLVPSEVLS